MLVSIKINMEYLSGFNAWEIGSCSSRRSKSAIFEDEEQAAAFPQCQGHQTTRDLGSSVEVEADMLPPFPDNKCKC